MAKETHEWTDGDIIEVVRNTVGKWVEQRDEMREEIQTGDVGIDGDWLDRYEHVVLELHSFKEMLAGFERANGKAAHEKAGRG